jgi:hypothetical protein
MNPQNKIIKLNNDLIDDDTKELIEYDSKYYKLRNAPGDGDCAYHSFIESMQVLHEDVVVPSDPTELRKQLIDFVKNDITYNQAMKREVIRRILSGVKNKGSGWAENEEFEMLAKMFDVCIAVWSELEKVWIYFYHNDIDIKLRGTDGCKRLIYLYNTSMKQQEEFDGINAINVYVSSNQGHGVHYDYLLPMKLDTSEDDSTDTDTESYEDDITLGIDTDTENEEYDTTDDEEDDTTDNGEENDSDEEMLNNNEELKQIKKIKKMSLKKRFEYFKNIIDDVDTAKQYSKIKKIMHVSNMVKPEIKTHRILEHDEYFVELNDNIPIDGFSFTKNQKFLKKFMSMDTRNVGLLLFHGVGVGKTCSSILIAENFVNMFDKKVLILLPSSLESNYRKELFDVTKLNYDNETYESCNGKKYLDNIPNWSKMSKMEVNKKIQRMISEEYSFYGYLKLVNFVEQIKKKSKQLFGKEQEDKRNLYVYTKLKEHFSNRIIIIDEVHNVRLSNEKSMKKFPKVLKMILRCADNVRLILLSATPMFDNAEEISWIMDFMYMVDRHYLSYDTSIEFEKDGVLTKSSVKKIKHFATNYVSYMRGYDPNTFPIKYYESESKINHPKKDMLKNKNIDRLKSEEYKFKYSTMKGHQLIVYSLNNVNNNESDIQNRIQLSNIVYPCDDDYKLSKGKRGFMNNFEEQDGKLLKVKYSSNKNQFLKYENLENYSSKLYTIISNIQSADGLVLVYSKYLYSGIIPCAIALEHIGYNKYNRNNILINDSKKTVSKGSYIIMTAEESISPNNVEELIKFNEASNMKGQNIKIALINEIAAEGVTFKNVREIHILEPWYNMNKIEQIIGRGVRYYSHHSLPENERNVSIYLHANIDNSEQETVDYRRYRTSLKKQDKINMIEKLMKENAIDCRINNIKGLIIDRSIVDSKGLKRKIKYQYDNIKCSQSEVKVVPLKEDNMNLRMLIFDIIEVSKQIIRIIESKSMYHFKIEEIRREYDNVLLKSTLDFMCKNKKIIRIKNIKGYLIKSKNEYFFQQSKIEDIKINIVDRKQTPKDYVGNYVISIDDTKTKTKLEDILLKDVEKSMKWMSQIFKDVNDVYIYDMVVDRIEYDKINELPNIQNVKLMKSLVDGGYVVMKDEDIYAYYNMYENVYMCNKRGTYVNCNVRENNVLLNEQNNRIMEMKKDQEMLGFVDIIEKTKKKKYEVKSKILYMDKSYDKSFGSACISTSTIKVQLLIEKIREYDDTVNLRNVNKKKLCLIYEYLLRKHKGFYRSIEYQLK